MTLNGVNDSTVATDSNALLRQIAVTFPQDVTWKENRSYMLAEVSHVREDEVHLRGYIRQNYVNAKRLVHLTGLPVLSWRIKRIEFASDPCPMKLSQKEKDKVLSTSRAQSIVSSRNSSRQSSRKGSFDAMEGIAQVTDSVTGVKCVQAAKTTGDDARDDDTVENNPGAFAAEQTWPTEAEMRSAAQRKGSLDQDEMVEMDTGNIGGFTIPAKKVGQSPEDLSSLFDKMQIKVVGRENQTGEDSGISDGDDSEEVGGVDEELGMQEDDPNFMSHRHKKHTDMETRAQDDMDFPDEVETPLKEARVRFQKYRGIKSLKNCDWDPYENLPEDYSKIWRFQNY